MGGIRGPNPHSASETELSFFSKVTSQVAPGFCLKSHTSEGGWDFDAFGPLYVVFHSTWDSPKWCTRLATLRESLVDAVHTTPRHPSSKSHVGVLADTCHSRWTGLPVEEVLFGLRFTHVPAITAKHIAFLTQTRRCCPRRSGHIHSMAVPHTRGLSPARSIQPTFQFKPSQLRTLQIPNSEGSAGKDKQHHTSPFGQRQQYMQRTKDAPHQKRQGGRAITEPRGQPHSQAEGHSPCHGPRSVVPSSTCRQSGRASF